MDSTLELQSEPPQPAVAPAGTAPSPTLGSRLFNRGSASLGYSLAALLAILGWFNRDNLALDAGSGLGYALGIIGGSLMLLLLLYSVRKRYRILRPLGALKYWFRGHMMLGIVGPLIILYHANFQVGSLNSQVALYCTLLVAVSGVVGRIIYAQIHYGLYGRKSSLAGLTANMQKSAERMSATDPFIGEVRDELVTIGTEVMTTPTSLLASATRPMVMAVRTRALHFRLVWKLRRHLQQRAAESPAVAEHQQRLLSVTRRYIQDHLKQVRRVAQFGFYERLFSWWHIIHVPFFIMMVLSALIHVVAVHLY